MGQAQGAHTTERGDQPRDGAADGPPGHERGPLRGVGARLLALTLAAVLIVSALIFIPSAAAFRTGWLTEKVETARLATLAALAAPDLTSSDELAQRLLMQAEIEAVSVKRAGLRELILTTDPAEAPPIRIDLRERGLWMAIIDTCLTFTAPEGRDLLIVDSAQMDDVEMIEVLVSEAPLKAALLGFTGRVFFTTLAITAVVAAGLYAAVTYMLVAPLRGLVAAMMRFREEPEDPTRAITPSERADEIGDAEAALAELQGQVRQALTQRGRLAALGEAVAKINHDLRNVLSSAQLISDRLAQNDDPQVRAQGERLVRSIDRGVRLAQEVLAYGKAEERPAARERVALRPVLEEAFTDAASAAEAAVGLDLQVEAEVAALGDEEFLHRVFLNLMRNAVVAFDGAEENGGRQDVITVTVGSENGFWVVEVADNGPGVPEKARARLFQPFSHSANRAGSGLGLAIARELARAQGGDVSLARTGPEGAAFSVRLVKA
ncbi:MAG: HAMP domain-containing sensor histidine kinase [Maricaulaceae bacterium]|jgi:signal transduction histidine kinase